MNCVLIYLFIFTFPYLHEFDVFVVYISQQLISVCSSMNDKRVVIFVHRTTALQDWLTESARLISKSGHTVEWVTPLGLPIIQPYHRTRSKVVSPILKGVRGGFSRSEVKKLVYVRSFVTVVTHNF